MSGSNIGQKYFFIVILVLVYVCMICVIITTNLIKWSIINYKHINYEPFLLFTYYLLVCFTFCLCFVLHQIDKCKKGYGKFCAFSVVKEYPYSYQKSIPHNHTWWTIIDNDHLKNFDTEKSGKENEETHVVMQ